MRPIQKVRKGVMARPAEEDGRLLVPGLATGAHPDLRARGHANHSVSSKVRSGLALQPPTDHIKEDESQ